MPRKFIATIAAAAIALTALGSAPARAELSDTERAIAAILGLAVVGKIIHDKKKRDKQEVTRDRRRTISNYTTEPHRPDRVRPGRAVPRVQPHVQPRPLPRRVNTRLLPRNCFRSFDTRRGTTRGFGSRCLNNNYRFAASLPHYCLTRIRTDRGTRRVYEARCLRDAGYRLARG